MLRRRRPGIALLTAVVVLAVVAALGVAAAFEVGQLHRGSDRLLADARLDAAAEHALGEVLAAWGGGRAAQPVGATTVDAVLLAGAESVAAVARVTRLSASVYLLVADVRLRPSDRAHRRVALVVSAAGGVSPRPVRERAWAELF